MPNSTTAMHSLIAPLSLDLVTKARPDSDWLYSTGGKPHVPDTDPLAAQVTQAWRPESTAAPVPMRPGWAGLASYRLPCADGDKHLKIVMVAPADKKEAYKKLCAETAGEVARASWAGRLGLGPNVLYSDASRGAFISDFVAGRSPTLAESQGPLLPLHLEAMARIHKQDAASVPSGGQGNWLLEDWINVEAQLAASKTPRPKEMQQALVQLEVGLKFFLARQENLLGVPIHDDFRPDNTIYNGSRMVVLDWNNLHVGPASMDLGHFACMVDIRAADLAKLVVTPYQSLLQLSGTANAPNNLLLDSTMAQTSLFRLRNAAFYDQWEGTRPKSEYLRHQIIDDVQAMAHTVLAEVGLRSDIKR